MILTLFILFLIIDVLIAADQYRKAYVERSNMNRKYKKRFAVILVLLLAAVAALFFNRTVACVIAGALAVPVTLFGAVFLIGFSMYKGPWR